MNSSQTKTDETQLTHDLLDDYASSRQNWVEQAVEDNEFRNGKQWSTEQVNALRRRAQEPLVVNVIYILSLPLLKYLILYIIINNIAIIKSINIILFFR